MNVFIIGTGLIGGSLALDLQQEYKAATIYGIDQNETHLNEAISLGLVHHVASLSDLNTADVVIIAIPVDASVEVIPNVLNMVNDHTLVMDTGSTKEEICTILEKHPKIKDKN